MYDVVTVGEGMLRLSPPRYERIRRMRTLDVHMCGSQGNVACNIARLGLKTAFVTKLPDNALGLLAKDHYMSCGVDASHIQLIPGARLGVNFIEFGATPRASAVVYDRKGSAASTIAPGDFDWDEILNGTRLAYTDGIFPGPFHQLPPGGRGVRRRRQAERLPGGLRRQLPRAPLVAGRSQGGHVGNHPQRRHPHHHAMGFRDRLRLSRLVRGDHPAVPRGFRLPDRRPSRSARSMTCSAGRGTPWSFTRARSCTARSTTST